MQQSSKKKLGITLKDILEVFPGCEILERREIQKHEPEILRHGRGQSQRENRKSFWERKWKDS